MKMNGHSENNSNGIHKISNSKGNIDLSEYNVAQLCISTRSKCGYCHGERSYVLDSKFQNDEITKENSSYCYGVLFLQLQNTDYVKLLNLGWRRSGKHLYKPYNFSSCCPALSIRLNTCDFQRSKTQRKIWNKIENLVTVTVTPSKPTKIKSKLNYSQEYALLQPTIDIITNWTIDALQHILLSHTTINPPLPILFIQETMSKCPYKLKKTNNYILYSSVCTAILGKYPTIYFPNHKLKLLYDVTQYINAKFLSTYQNNNVHILNITVNEKSLQLQYAIVIKQSLQTQPMEIDIPIIQSKEKVTFTIRSIPSHISAKDPEVHRLYTKYQTSIHNDPDPYNSSQEEIQSSFESFYKFLGDTPLPYNNNQNDGDDVSIPYGSYHQQYRLNDKLIAVGVVDILPTCLSSVYSFYDPSYSNYNLGTYTALYEISWVQRRYALNKDVQYYYLGYYIHSCGKMKYKAEFKPSELLCPTSYRWSAFDTSLQKILSVSPIRHCCTLVDSIDGTLDNDTKQQLINSILLEIGTTTTTNNQQQSMDQVINEDPPINVQNVIANSVPASHVNAYYRQVIDPLLEEFVDNVGIDVSRHCVIQM